MARPFSRFINKLTKSQIQKLNELKDAGITCRERHRAHAILLSYQGKNVAEIASIFQVHRHTILEWLDRWDAFGLESLPDQPRSGSPSKSTESEQAQALAFLKESPHNPALVLSQIEQETGKQISRSTLKRLAKRAGLIWKRMRKSLGSKQDAKKNPSISVN